MLGGAVTIGPGMIVGEQLKEYIRSHLDIEKEKPNTKYLKPAVQFYD